MARWLNGLPVSARNVPCATETLPATGNEGEPQRTFGARGIPPAFLSRCSPFREQKALTHIKSQTHVEQASVRQARCQPPQSLVAAGCLVLLQWLCP